MPSGLIMLAILLVTGLGVAWLYGQVRGRDLHDVERWDHARVVTSAWTSGAGTHGDGTLGEQPRDKQDAEAEPQFFFLRRAFWTGHWTQVGVAALLGLVLGVVINPAPTTGHDRPTSATAGATSATTNRANHAGQQVSLIEQQRLDAQMAAVHAEETAAALARQAAQARQADLDRRQADLDKRTAELAAREATVSAAQAAASATPTRVLRPTATASRPPGATAQCRDGTYGFSPDRTSACTSHGGVAISYT